MRKFLNYSIGIASEGAIRPWTTSNAVELPSTPSRLLPTRTTEIRAGGGKAKAEGRNLSTTMTLRVCLLLFNHGAPSKVLPEAVAKIVERYKAAA